MAAKENFSCWLLAFALSCTNFTNGWTWIIYASISDFTSKHYHVSLEQVNWISLLYAVIMTVGSLPFIWIINLYGVKLSLTLAAVLNLLCALVHVASSSVSMNLSYRYTILIIGSILGGFAQPLSLFSSTKLAATWFSVGNRVSANSLAAMGNVMGVLFSNILSPMVVTDQSKVPLLNNISLIPPTVALLVVLISVCLAPKSLDQSIDIPSLAMSGQMKICFRNFEFWIIAVCFGINLAIFTTISMLIQQILCPLGYSDMFSGICGALLLAMGIPGVLVIGPVVTRLRVMTDIVKSGIVLATIGLVGFSIASTIPHCHIWIALSLVIMGFFGLGVYPLALELAAETVHRASEVLSTGVLITISQALSLVFVIISEAIAVTARRTEEMVACSLYDDKNYWIATTSLAVVGVVNATVFLFCFSTKYKRVISECEQSNSGELYIPLVDDAK